MAVRVKFDAEGNLTFDCDTPEEAVEVEAKRAKKASAPVPAERPTAKTRRMSRNAKAAPAPRAVSAPRRTGPRGKPVTGTLSPAVLAAARAWSPPEAAKRFALRLSGNEKVALGLIATQTETSLNDICLAAGHKKTDKGSSMLYLWKGYAEACGLEWEKLLPHRIEGRHQARMSFYRPGPLLKERA
jgi:hypothetical protein